MSSTRCSSVPSLYPGTPAAWCCTYNTSLPLQRLLETLRDRESTLVWLDSARLHPVTGRYSLLGWDPWLTLSAHGSRLTLRTTRATSRTFGNPLTLLRKTLMRYPGLHHDGLPPVGLGWFGVFSYELNRWVERLPHPKPGEWQLPELMVFGMRMLVVVDHATETSWCVSLVDPHQPEARARREARARLEAVRARVSDCQEPQGQARHSDTHSSTHPHRRQSGVRRAATIQPTMSQPQFEAMVRCAQDSIKAGEIFQANLAQQFTVSWPESPWHIYLALRQINPSPFACFLQCPEVTIVSCSPERLVRVSHGRAEARPIAGTRPRGSRPEEDLVNSLELILSDKERAEHIMLVDLARNDLGRVCRAGSVVVDDLMTLEDYSHVIHIVSNVCGALSDGIDVVDVLRAMFPGGTITGCPKVRCMEIIHALEPVARGLYTGSLGYMGFDGSMDLNILIRTIVAHRDRMWFHVGAGIVADSQPDREYAETLAKAGALIAALQSSQVGEASHVSLA